MNSARLTWRALLVVFALAFALRAVAVVQYESAHPQAQRPAIDEASYDTWAREIAGGELLGREIFFQEPLYPYALGAVYAAAGEDPTTRRSVARWLQAALGALTACAAAALAARLFGKTAGWIAGALVALHRPAVWFPVLLLKENVFLLVLAALALGLVRTREQPVRWSLRSLAPWLGLGALAAVGALLRGNLLVMLPLLALWPIARALLGRAWSSAAFGAALAFSLGAALTLLPVALRNQYVGGRFVLTTSGAGTNFYGGNNLQNPYGLATEFDWVRGVPEHEAGDWRREASRRVGRELDATETSAFWMRTTLESMRTNPGEHALILWRKLRLTLGDYEVPDNHFLEWDARFVPVLRAPLPSFGLVGTLALAAALALLLAGKPAEAADDVDRGTALEVALLATLYLGTVVLTVTSERIRMPLVPLLAPFAGGWLVLAVSGLKRFLVLVAATAACAWFVLAPVLPADDRAADFDERDYNLAVSLLEESQVEPAAILIEGLLERRGAAPRLQLVAAEIEYRRARAVLDGLAQPRRVPDEVGQRIETSLRMLEGVSRRGNAQERFRADLLAGAIRQYLGQWHEAEDAYRAALAFDPENRDLRRRLSVVVAEQAMLAPAGEARASRLREAIAILEELLATGPDPELAQLVERMRAQL